LAPPPAAAIRKKQLREQKTGRKLKNSLESRELINRE
jgi:hypothetical protein